MKYFFYIEIVDFDSYSIGVCFYGDQFTRINASSDPNQLTLPVYRQMCWQIRAPGHQQTLYFLPSYTYVFDVSGFDNDFDTFLISRLNYTN